MSNYDVILVGAGPAGIFCAYELMIQNKGLKVLLVEKDAAMTAVAEIVKPELAYVSNRRLSQVISADYFRRKHLSQSAVNDADAHYTGGKRRLSRAYFSAAEAGLK